MEEIRPLVDGRKVEVAVAAMDTRDDDVVFGPYYTMDQDGIVPIRSDARYHRLRVRMPPGWQDAVGLDLLGQASGGR